MAANNKRVFTREFKLVVARQLVRGEKRISQACREHSLCESVVRRWKLQYERSGENAWTPQAATAKPAVIASASSSDEPAALTNRVQDLEAALGRAHLEIEFLRLALEKKPSLPRRASR
jgi:transposase-like protein